MARASQSYVADFHLRTDEAAREARKVLDVLSGGEAEFDLDVEITELREAREEANKLFRFLREQTGVQIDVDESSAMEAVGRIEDRIEDLYGRRATADARGRSGVAAGLDSQIKELERLSAALRQIDAAGRADVISDEELRQLREARSTLRQMRADVGEMDPSLPRGSVMGGTEQAARAQREVAEPLEGVRSENRSPIRVPVEGDTAPIRRDIEQVENEAAEGRIQLRVESEQIDRNIDKLEEAFHSKGYKIDINADDAEKARAELDRVRDALDDAEARKDLDIDESDAEEVRGLLSAMDRNLDALEEVRKLNVDASDPEADLGKLMERNSRLQKELKQTTSVTMKARGAAQDSMQRTTQHSQNMLRVLQDSQYGMMGMANNLQEVSVTMASFLDGSAAGIDQNMNKVQRLGAGLKAAFMPLISGPMAIATITVALTMLAQNWDKVTAAVDSLMQQLSGVSAEARRAREALSEMTGAFESAVIEKGPTAQLEEELQARKEEIEEINAMIVEMQGQNIATTDTEFLDSIIQDTNRLGLEFVNLLGLVDEQGQEVLQMRRRLNRLRDEGADAQEEILKRQKEIASEMAEYVTTNEDLLVVRSRIARIEGQITDAENAGNEELAESLQMQKSYHAANEEILVQARELSDFATGFEGVELGIEEAARLLQSGEMESLIRTESENIREAFAGEEGGDQIARDLIKGFRARIEQMSDGLSSARADLVPPMLRRPEPEEEKDEGRKGPTLRERVMRVRELQNEATEDALSTRLEAVEIEYDQREAQAREFFKGDEKRTQEAMRALAQSRRLALEEAEQGWNDELRLEIEAGLSDSLEQSARQMEEKWRQSTLRGIRDGYRSALDGIEADAERRRSVMYRDTEIGTRARDEMRARMRLEQDLARNRVEANRAAREATMDSEATLVGEDGRVDPEVAAMTRGNDRVQAILRRRQNMWAAYSEQKEERQRQSMLRVRSMQEQMVTGLSGVLGSLAEMQDESTKAGFERQKKMMYAQAVMSAVASGINIWKSYSSMGPWGVAAAAVQSGVVVAKLMAQAQKIKNMSFDGSGGGGRAQGSFTSLSSDAGARRAQRYEEGRRGRGARDAAESANRNEELVKSVNAVGDKIADQKVVLEDRTSSEAAKRAVERQNDLEV